MNHNIHNAMMLYGLDHAGGSRHATATRPWEEHMPVRVTSMCLSHGDSSYTATITSTTQLTGLQRVMWMENPSDANAQPHDAEHPTCSPARLNS